MLGAKEVKTKAKSRAPSAVLSYFGDANFFRSGLRLFSFKVKKKGITLSLAKWRRLDVEYVGNTECMDGSECMNGDEHADSIECGSGAEHAVHGDGMQTAQSAAPSYFIYFPLLVCTPV